MTYRPQRFFTWAAGMRRGEILGSKWADCRQEIFNPTGTGSGLD